MKGIDNELYLTLLVISNIIAILLLVGAFKWPRITRLAFFFLFGWACWINWKTSQQSPDDYLTYALLSMSTVYSNFILGWFSQHIQLAVGFVATCQGLIALSMLLHGTAFKLGSIGAIIFLLAILPLGVGAGIPSTAIMAVAIFILMKKDRPVFNVKHPGLVKSQDDHDAHKLVM